MTLFLIKLIATPLIVAGAGWASRRWGAAAGGWMAGMPVTSGPISVFLAYEYGPQFAAQAALGTLYAMPAIAACAVGYVWAAQRGHGWVISMIACQGSYLAMMTLLLAFGASTVVVFLLSLAALACGIAVVGLRERPMLPSMSSRSVLLLRIMVATGLVLIVTLIAPLLGPTLSGLAGTIMIIAAVLAAASHIEHGAQGGIAVIRGMMLGQIAFLAFYTVVWALLPSLGMLAYLPALIAAGVTGFVVSRATARLMPAVSRSG